MAWITKNSAGMKIDRRPEPYLTPQMKDDFEKNLLPRYATRRAALIQILHVIQHHYNWIPYQALEEVAAFVGISSAEAFDTASFYEDFYLQPKGKYLISVCQSISCELCGQVPLLDKLKAKLGVEPGQTTDDGRFTLRTVECLGSCGTAPVALINDDLHENLTFEKLETILDELK